MSTTTVRERPILFSGEMVRAILEGRKAQTRRVVKPQPNASHNGANPMWYDARNDFWRDHDQFVRDCCPFGAPGDRLWVRETHSIDECVCQAAPSVLRGSCKYCHGRGELVTYKTDGGKYSWRPSIHMPRWASRITLEITDVRVERLQEMSPDDLTAEGFPPDDSPPHDGTRPTLYGRRMCFAELWDRLNEKRGYPWDSNPWVWALTFRVVGG